MLTEVLRATVDPQQMADILVSMVVKDRRFDALAYLYDRLDGRPLQATADISSDSPASLAMRELAAEMRAARLADAGIVEQPYQIEGEH